MNEEFIPYEEALILKELGFDLQGEEFGYYYLYNNKPSLETQSSYDYGTHNNRVSAPLFQQAFRWFREKYNMYCTIMPADLGKYEKGNPDFQAGIYSRDPVYVEGLNTFNTYEEAELACLRKLIEIVNQNKDDENIPTKK